MPGNFRWGFANQPISLRWTAPYQETGLYPQARVLDNSGSVVATVNLSANSTISYVYEGSWTPSSEGFYSIVYDIYTNSNRTTKSQEISGAEETVLVKDISGARAGKQLGKSVAEFSETDIKRIAEVVAEKVWKFVLESGKQAGKELINKSEFNVKKDSVSTDMSTVLEPLKDLRLELQSINPREFENRFISLISKLQESLKKDIDRLNLEKISNTIRDLNFELQSTSNELQRIDFSSIEENLSVLLKTLNSHKEILFKFDDAQRANFEKLITLIKKLPFSQSIQLNGLMNKLRQEMLLMNE